MGTVAYMSPEQARGEELDARSDLFSFGAVLYEMATGRQAFTGNTAAVVFHAILAEMPISPIRLNPSLPADLARTISKALEKNRELRCQTASEMRADLKRVKRDAESARSAAREKGTRTPEKRTTPPARSFWLAGSLALIVAGIAAGWLLRRTSSQPSAQLTQRRLTFNSSENYIGACGISPDGKYLAYDDSAGIHVKLLSTGEERVISRPAGVPASASWRISSWFFDGTQLLAQTQQAGAIGSIWTVSLVGRSPRQLRDRAWGWGVSPDGTQVAFSPEDSQGEVWLMDSQGDNARLVLALDESQRFLEVHWSPDGGRLAYLRERRNLLGIQMAAIETCDLKGANRTVVVPDTDVGLDDFCWLAGDRIVYSRYESPRSHDENIWQISLDGRSAIPIGKPKSITQWVGSDVQDLTARSDGKRLALLR